MVDVQIGKSKYRIGLTLLVAAFGILVSSIGWILSLQMTVEATKTELAELKAIVREIEIPDTTFLETKDTEMSTKIMWMMEEWSPKMEKLDDELDDFDDRLSEIEGTQRVIENEMRSIMSDHSGFADVLRQLKLSDILPSGERRQYGNYD